MPETHTKVVILIAECAFEQKLIALFEQAGVTGYWAEKLERGRGRHGTRAGTLERERLMKLTTVVSPAVAAAILHELTDSLLPAYGIKAVKAVQVR